MKKYLLTLCLAFLIPFIAAAGTQTYQFTQGNGTTALKDDQGGTWTYSGFNFNSNQVPGTYGGSGASNRGFSTASEGSLTSDATFENVTKVTVDASFNAASGSVSVSVGGTLLGTASATSSNHQLLEFTSASPVSGAIKITAKPNSKTGWVAGFKVETDDSGQGGGSAPDPAEFWDDQSNTITGTYTYTATDENPNCTVYGVVFAPDVTYTYTVNPTSALVSAEDDGMGTIEFAVNATCDITVTTANADGKTTDATLKVVVKQPTAEITGTQTFELVKQGGTVSTGDVVVFIEQSNFYGPVVTPNTSAAAIAGTTDGIKKNDDGTVEIDPTKIAIFNVVDSSTTGKFALQYQSGEYLTAGTSNTSFSSTTDLTKANTTFEVVANNYANIIVNERNVRGYATNTEFRSYSGTSNQAVYLYRMTSATPPTPPVEKETVTLAWDKGEHTYDLDFGWQDGEPSLTATPEVDGDIITYASSATGVATVAADGKISPVAVGTAEISAVVDPANATYKSEEVAFTLNVVGANAPAFADATGTNFDANEVTLFESELAEGYVLNIKGTEGYGLKVTVEPETAATVAYNGNDATVTIKEACTITALNTKTVNDAVVESTKTTTFKVNSKADPIPGQTLTFELVKKDDTIAVGDVVVIFEKDKTYSVSPKPNTTDAALTGVTTGFTFNENGTVDVDFDNVAVFNVVEGNTEGHFALQYQSGEYLTLPTSGTTNFNSSSTVGQSADVTFAVTSSDYCNLVFTKQNRNLRGYNGNFRSYSGTSSGTNIYLYRLVGEKEPVTLEWDKAAYTYDLDFGWQDGEPSLTSTPEVAADIIVYSTSDAEIATVSNTEATRGQVTAKAKGEVEISAIIDPKNKTYQSEAAVYTLNVVGANTPVFVGEDDAAFEENLVALLPSVLKAGYTFNIKGTEGYGLKVTINPTTAGTVTMTDGGATVTVTKDCTVTARNTITVNVDGEDVVKEATRYASFKVQTVDLPKADISWTAARYIYDLDTKQWDNTPALINNDNLPLTYTSSDETVATVNAAGKITPLKQGNTTISASFEGDDNVGANTVTAHIRVTDSSAPLGYDLFEMVKKGDQLRENEQFIIVSGEPINPESAIGSSANVGGKYYAISPYRFIDSTVHEYYEGIPVDFPEGDESGERLWVADDSNVLRLSKQYDTSGANPAYPYLFQVMNEDVDINGDGEILDTDNPTVGSGNNERINGRYIQVQKAKLFSFVDLPENIDERGMMNGNIRVLDPNDADLAGYEEKDYINIIHSAAINYKGTLAEFTDKGEIIFNGTDGKQYFVRFNPGGNAVHFNVYELDGDYNATTKAKSNTFPVRIYRLTNRVEKPSITVYPEEPVSSDVAYEDGVTYNNKVRVVIERHPKTSASAKLMRQWQKEGRNPALPDYESFSDNQVVVYVDGNVVVDENNNFIRYIDPDFDTATATRTLFAVSSIDDVYSESANATFNFKTLAPRINKVDTDAEGQINVRVARPATYTKDAVYYYLISDDNSKPEVTFNQDGTVSSATGTVVAGSDSEDTIGYITLPAGSTLWVGAFKAGYQPTVVEYTNNTVFPECRPMQLLRITDEGRDVLLKDMDLATIFGGKYDASKPLYINYRNDLINEDGTAADSDHHFHYMIQREHEYGTTSQRDRQVKIEQISEEQFRSVFGDNNIDVDAEHAKNFQWTSDFYVFALNEDDFYANFGEEEVLLDPVKVETSNRTYEALHNTFMRKATNSDGSYVDGAEAEEVSYYGALLENQGKLGMKAITTKLTYMTEDARLYETETSAEVAPRIPAMLGFSYHYQYAREEAPSFADENPDAVFAKIKVPSSIEGQDASEVLIPIEDLKTRHLNLVFKFNRPNISKYILQHYDIYYTLKYSRVTEGEADRLIEGSGVYVDTEEAEGEDAVYRFRIDNVNPLSTVYPKLEISKVTYVGNSSSDSYGQYASNFGEQKTVEVAPNNSARRPLEIGGLKLRKESTQEIAGREYSDWQYISHSDFVDNHDVVIGDDTENPVVIESSFYHIETYVPDTDYYSSYEYLVKHDNDSHAAPADPEHPFNKDGYSQYDALRHTIIARNVPAKDNFGATVKPKVVIAPVYFFNDAPDMKPVAIDEDDNLIDEFATEGGYAHITKVNDLAEAATVAPVQAPRRAAAATGTEAPSTKDYPMPHAGDTDMNHATILDLTNNSAYTVVKGGNYESEDLVVTGIEDVYAPNADGTPRYYNMQGIRVENPEHGIYIRVINGQSEKVVL